MTGPDVPVPRARVLVTGAGGAAAVAIARSIAPFHDVIAADIDPVAVGLYLAPPEDRWLLPRGDDQAFLPALLDAAVRSRADLVIPTVDTELTKVADARDAFAGQGIALLVELPATLATCLDKAALMQACADTVEVPGTVVLGPDTTDAELHALGAPFIVKPRRGAGGRGFAVLAGIAELAPYPRDGSWLVQELLPGEEYSIDVLARPDGHIVAAVPRSRDKVDSGIAVAGRTVEDPQLVAYGRAVAQAIGATGVVNVQVRRARDGSAKLLEVNPRFPGSMPLTMAAGVDMPRLAVAAALGAHLPDTIGFTETAVVRHWTEVAVPIAEYRAIATAAAVSGTVDSLAEIPVPVVAGRP